MSVFIIIEDDEEYFEMMVDVVKEVDQNYFIIPSGDAQSKKAFRLSYLDYLISPTPKNSENLKNLIFVEPEYFVLDFSLLNFKTNKMDSWGGIFRQNFVKKYYPNAKVTFFSIYAKDQVSPFMELNDHYFSKLPSDSLSDIKNFWKINMEFFINK